MSDPLWQTPVYPAPLVPQPYALWCAEFVDDSVSIGRVVAWKPHAEGPLLPVVAWEVPDSQRATAALPVDERGVWFLGDTRTAALAAAENAARFVCPDHGVEMRRAAEGRYGCPVPGCLNAFFPPVSSGTKPPPDTSSIQTTKTV